MILRPTQRSSSHAIKFIRDYHFSSYAELQEPQLRRMWEQQLVDVKPFMPYNYAMKHTKGVILTCTCSECGGGKKTSQETWEKHTGFRVEKSGYIKWMITGEIQPDTSGVQTFAERLEAQDIGKHSAGLSSNQ